MKGQVLRLAFASSLIAAVVIGGVGPSLAAPTKLIRLSYTLPFARSGATYSFRLAATGGTPPYHCVPMHLTNSGSVSLNANCVISGTAPVVSYERITGPFTFVLTDSGNPSQRVAFTGMNFTTKKAPWRAQDLDGQYACTGSITTTSNFPDGTKTVLPVATNHQITVVDGKFNGTMIHITNEFGDGSLMSMQSVDGVTLSDSATFTRALSGNGVTVLEMISGGGAIPGGGSIHFLGTVHCHRTVVTP